jgi:hypothetical protein
MLEDVWVGGGWRGSKGQGVVVVLVAVVAVVHIVGGQLLCEIVVAVAVGIVGRGGGGG